MEMKRNDYLVKTKFYKYLIPSFLMEVAIHAGTVMDAVIVGNLLGIESLSAITLSGPVIQVLHIPGLIMGLGGATLAAVWLGERRLQDASQIFSVCIIAGTVLSLLAGLSAFWITGPMAHMVAADPQLQPLVEEYLFVNVLGLPILSLTLLVAEFVGVDNHPNLGAWIFGIAEVVNVIMDIVYIKCFDLGIEGAAIATITGYVFGLFVTGFYAKSKERMLRLSIKGIKWLKNGMASLKTGMPRITMELMQALQLFVLNTAVLQILGIEAMEVYAVCTNTLIFAELLAGGIISVIPHTCGVLFGEKDFYAIRRLVKKLLFLSGGLIAFLTAVFMVFPERIAILFGIETEELIPTAAVCLQIYSISFIPFVFNEFLQVYYQTILETTLATLDTILEFFALLLPITFLLMHYWGIYGVCVAVPLSEILTIIIVDITRRIQQRRGKYPQEGILMIPNHQGEDDDSLDVTIEAGDDSAVAISEKVMEYCRNRNADEQAAYVLGLAAEEMAVNIERYGYRKDQKPYIDINLSHDGEHWILRIRDDGVPFDPTTYHPGEEDGFLLGGINLIRKRAKKFSYLRVLNMNNTIIEV